jgi:two-component system LytT family response regulator
MSRVSINEPNIKLLFSNTVLFIDFKEIKRVEGSVNYSIIHTQEGSKYLSSKTLKQMQNLLTKAKFIRIHKSHIINTNFVKRILTKGGKCFVELINGELIEASRRMKKNASLKILPQIQLKKIKDFVA